MLVSFRALVLAGVVILVLAAVTRPDPAGAGTKRISLVEQIADYRSETWSWQRLMRVPRTPSHYGERRTDEHQQCSRQQTTDADQQEEPSAERDSQ